MKKITFFVLTLIILFTSCTENSFLEADDPQNTEINLKSKGDRGDKEVRSPLIHKDILEFDDLEHFVSFYSYLNDVYDDGEDVYDSTVDQLLADFPSVKRKIDIDVFTNPDDRYQPFITDPIMSTLVNENFEVIIEDMFIVQMNNDEIVQMDISNVEGRQLIQDMEKGVKVDADLLPDEVFVGKDQDEEIFKRNILCGCSIDMELIDCNTIEISGRCRNFWKDTDGELTIEIINGQTTTVNVNGNYSTTVDVTGVPLNFVTLKVTAKPDCALGSSTTKTQNFTVGSHCDTDENDTGWGWTENSGQAISYRTATYKTLFFVYEEAKLYSYAWSPNGFTRNKAKLIVSIDATRKNNICGTINQEDETKSCGNCNYKRARINWYTSGGAVTDIVAYCTGDVVGTYFKEKSNISVNATAIPEYDCCM